MNDKEKLIVQSLDYLIEKYKDKKEAKQLEEIKNDFINENQNKYNSWNNV